MEHENGAYLRRKMLKIIQKKIIEKESKNENPVSLSGASPDQNPRFLCNPDFYKSRRENPADARG